MRAAALVCGAALLAVLPARAQEPDELLGGGAFEADYRESPQHFALEFKAGPYLPEVDAEFGGAATPYDDMFGDTDLLLTALSFDWEFIRVPGDDFSVGTFSVGLTLGFMQAVGASRTSDGRASGEDTVLNVIPIHYSAGFRFDMLAEEYDVPIVLYVKGGISTYYWWILNGGGTAAWGWTPGWHFIPGIALRLDWFETSTSQDFDATVGVNHSYLICEMVLAGIDGLGTDRRMDLSDLTWMLGLAFEF